MKILPHTWYNNLYTLDRFKLKGKAKWNYLCKCGNKGHAFEFMIQSGRTHSCIVCARIASRKVKVNTWYNDLMPIKTIQVKGIWKWEYICKCGNKGITTGSSILNGGIKSCKLCANKRTAKRMTKHSLHGTKGYSSWKGIHSRCNSKTNPRYKDYGARGINVCKEWQTDFAQFIKDMGIPPDNHVLDRRDNNGPYNPKNCRWVSNKVNCNNTRRNLNITYIGRTLTLQQWADFLHISSKALRYRIHANNPLSKVFEILN